MSTPRRAPIQLSKWMPGKLIDAESSIGRSLLGLTAFAPFDDSASRLMQAATELESLYSNDDVTDVAAPLTPTAVNVKSEFAIPKCHYFRLLAPNPLLYTRMLNMPKSKFILAYKEFMYEMHRALVTRTKNSGKITFDMFNPPYWDGRICFLLPHKKYGAQRLQTMEVNGPSVPTVHDLDKSRIRPLATCLLALWIDPEPASRDFLLYHLAHQKEVFTVDDYELLGFVSGAIKEKSPLEVARRHTANLASGNLGDRDIISHPNYTLTVVQINTLRPLCPPCAEVIDAFLSYLIDDDTYVLPTAFTFNLVLKSTEKMLSWLIPETASSRGRNILVPLHSRATSHWGLAVI